MISIHALLAESDGGSGVGSWPRVIFLSTLSLRRATAAFGQAVSAKLYFYPRSPCGERRWLRCWQLAARDISIHALLAESDATKHDQATNNQPISIHALLAESDDRTNFSSEVKPYFYPRSPCGERRVHYDNYNLHCVISIHALLAESDLAARDESIMFVFLSTLSLRRATKSTRKVKQTYWISIHALLAESDRLWVCSVGFAS